MESGDTDRAGAKRPRFRCDASRGVCGGDGIVPDFFVREDTTSTLRQEFLRSVAPKGQQIQIVLQQYSGELREKVSHDFIVPASWSAELRRRLKTAGVNIDTRYDSVAIALLTDELAR